MARDALFNNVSLLLHCDGSNGSTTFTDNCPAPKVVTAVNGAQISTAQSKWGGASGLFDGTNDYLTAGNAADWKHLHDDTTDYAIEGWVYWNGGSSDLAILSTAAGSADIGMILQVLGSNSRKLNVQIYRGASGSNLSSTSSSGITSGAWTYFKFSYTKTTRAYAFRIGSSDAGSGTMTVTGTWPASSTSNPSFTLAIGRYQNAAPGGYLNGYLDDLRITRAARTETAEPTAAFPDTAPVHKAIDRCKETTSTTGTGNLTLAGAMTGYVGVTNASTGLVDELDTSWFCAESGSQWEIFLGTRVSATELARSLISSSTGSTINFTNPPVVYSTVPADRLRPRAFKAYGANSDQSLTSSVYTKVQLNVEELDSNGEFDSVTNHRWTPLVAGWYLVTYKVNVSAASLTLGFASLYKNGMQFAFGSYAPPVTADAISVGSELVFMNGSTDYLELFAYGVGTTLVVRQGPDRTTLSGVLVVPAE